MRRFASYAKKHGATEGLKLLRWLQKKSAYSSIIKRWKKRRGIE